MKNYRKAISFLFLFAVIYCLGIYTMSRIASSLAEQEGEQEPVETVDIDNVDPPVPVPAPVQNLPSSKTAGDLLEFTLKGVQWRFRWCPSGEFLMGSPSGEKGRDDDETQHRVRLTRGFWLGETVVTQERWEAVWGINPSNFKGATLPVECVSWDDCQKFIGKLNELNVAPSGFKFSLPTEAQWEYACRAGSTTAYCFGDAENKVGDYAWYSSNSGLTTHPVGTKKANAWGLYDMHGNVWEWCNDWYANDYPTVSVTDPTGATSGSYRVCRGGGWSFLAQYCRSAGRDYYGPSDRYNSLGLRLSLVSESR